MNFKTAEKPARLQKSISTIIKRAITRAKLVSLHQGNSSKVSEPLPVELEYLYAIFKRVDADIVESENESIFIELWNILIRYASPPSQTSSSAHLILPIDVSRTLRSHQLRMLFIIDALIHKYITFRNYAANFLPKLLQTLTKRVSGDRNQALWREEYPLLDYLVELFDLWSLLYDHENTTSTVFSSGKRYLRENLQIEAPTIQTRLLSYENEKAKHAEERRSIILRRVKIILSDHFDDLLREVEQHFGSIEASLQTLFPSVIAPSVNDAEEADDDEFWENIPWETIEDDSSEIPSFKNDLPTMLPYDIVINLNPSNKDDPSCVDIYTSIKTSVENILKVVPTIKRWEHAFIDAIQALEADPSDHHHHHSKRLRANESKEEEISTDSYGRDHQEQMLHSRLKQESKKLKDILQQMKITITEKCKLLLSSNT